MSLSYKIKEIRNIRKSEGKPCYAVTVVNHQNVSLDTLAEEIDDMCSFTTADVTGVLNSLIKVLVRNLAAGHTVTLDGLGTFSLSAELCRDISDPAMITGNDIRLKRVCFKPCPKFKSRLTDVGFIRHES